MSFTVMESIQTKERVKRRGRADYVMEVVKDLTCPICLEFYTHPVILPCSHVLCRRPCAENIFDVNFIRCPVCRENCYISGGITALPRVITLESIIEKVRAERKKRAATSKAWSSVDSASDVTSQDISNDDTTPDVTLCGRGFDFTPIRSPDIASSRSPDQSSSVPTLTSSTSATVTTPIAPHTLLERLNLQLNLPYHDSLLLSTTSSVTAPTHRLDTPTSSLDREIENILSTVGAAGDRILPVTSQINEQQYSVTDTNTCQDAIATHNQRTTHNAQGNSISLTASTSQCLTSNSSSKSSLSGSTEHSHEKNRSSKPSDSQTQVLNTRSHVAGLQGDNLVSSTTSTPRRHPEIVSSHGDDLPRDINYVSDTHVELMKHEIQERLQKLCDVQCQLLVYLTSYRIKADGLQNLLETRRSEINTECDSLVAVIEHKRNNFMLNVDNETKRAEMEVGDVAVATEKLLTSTQQLSSFAEQILGATQEVLVETAPVVLDRLSSAVKECELCLLTSEPRLRSILNHNVDLRNERAVLRSVDYLTIPSQPIIDVQRCTRNNETVALVMAPPPASDVIDSYEITYYTDEQKRLGIEERYYAKLSSDVPRASPAKSWLKFILIENLCRSKHYYFSACALNKEGRSRSSDHVQCVTLGQQECVVPVPVIIESSCQASSHHVTLYCPSPANVAAHQGVSHFVLYRKEGGAFLWQGEELQTAEEHRVQGLRPDSDYQFLVLACNDRGECQVSDKISIRTSSV